MTQEPGVAFPAVDGRRSTSATGRAVVADAVRGTDPGLAATVERESDWRRGYLPAFRRLTEVGAASAQAATRVADAGLASVQARFRYVTPDGAELPLDEAQRRPAATLGRLEVRGTADTMDPVLSVPYRGGRLAGAALEDQLARWVDAGVAEPSFAEAVHLVAANPEWLDLRDLTVAVLGAGAEMGPFVSLVRWGAHVVPVDLPQPQVWERLLDRVRRSPGRATVPVRRDGAPGVDLAVDAPALGAWLAGLDGAFTLGHYVYADGAAHVRTTVAIDALTRSLLAARSDVSLAFLATPTDAFVVPEDVVEDSRRRREAGPAWQRAVRPVTAGRLFVPAYRRLISTDDGRLVGVNDSLVPQQGPNYALAKRIQRWRAVAARRDGHLVSANVAPATRTRSVVRNRVLAAAYAGAHSFGVEVFDPSTSNTLMAALLVHDLRNPAAPAHPDVALGHPDDLLVQGANPGGLWRNPWSARSVLGLAVALGLVQRGA